MRPLIDLNFPTGTNAVRVVQLECPSVITSQAVAQNILERSLEQESTYHRPRTSPDQFILV